MKICNALLCGFALMFSACSSNSDVADNERKDIVLNGNEIAIVDTQISSAFDMLRYFDSNSKEGNFMVSPLSIQFSLGMLANGAQGKTLDEITAALGSHSLDELNDLNKRLLSELPKADKKTTIRSANSVWLNKGLNVYPEYSRSVADFYRAEAATVDLSTEETMKRINDWCSSKTEGMIPTVIKEPYTDNTAFVMLNALYFKGEWQKPFKNENTVNKEFTNSDGTVSNVATMCKKENMYYFKGEKYELARMTYGNGAYAMTLLLPSEDSSLSEALQTLTPYAWSTWKRGREIRDCNLKMPKFSIATHFELDDYFKSIGIKEVYDSAKADLSVMSDKAVYLSKSDQFTRIEVDEKGTVATAVTKLEGEYTDVIHQPVEFHVNRTFAFIIEETSTGAVLFTGRVNKL
ncbi:serpin family protein [uncultured Duncaniella sp.]|jgi:serpin B|uniref:serpin family protein n=1 Tax=uncultured Duncaniella sp. TaxID=2768039 RepID=UPI00272EEECC|nr:serpin family protein [uncultured Duncaniella sp.]